MVLGLEPNLDDRSGDRAQHAVHPWSLRDGGSNGNPERACKGCVAAERPPARPHSQARGITPIFAVVDRCWSRSGVLGTLTRRDRARAALAEAVARSGQGGRELL